MYTQKPPRFPSTARAVALCLRGGLLRRAVLERSRACLPLDAQRPRWGAFGALPVCRAQRTPITYDVSPATMLFKPALLSYRRNALAAPYACPVEDHCPAICFRVGRMHWQPAKRRNEANCRRPVRPARSRGVCRYVIWRPSRPKARVRLARPRRPTQGVDIAASQARGLWSETIWPRYLNFR